ncbi:MAG TPA: hypothetical protein VL069_11545, partial [Opitutus sp.]|nr:hypothetical protein [Opitutus sp.]
MQLSAPTLPIDPGAGLSADASGFPASGGKGDTNASAASDFGAMLSAESRGNNRSSSTARSNQRAPTKEAGRSVDDNQSTREFSSGERPTSSVNQRQASATTSTTPEAAAAGLIVPTQPSVATQQPAGVEIDLTINLPSPALGNEETNTSAEVISSDGGSAASARIVAGRGFSGEMPAGQSRAGIHAYGWRGETPAGSPVSIDSAQAALEHGSAALGEPSDPGSTNSAASLPPSTHSAVAETSTLGAQSAATLSSKSVASLATDAGRVEQIGGSIGEVTAADPAEERAVVDDLIQPEALPSLAANIPEGGSADGAEIFEPAATAAVAEKIAAQLSRLTDRAIGSNKSTQRVSLDASSKDVASSHDRIGINVAKPDALMPALASTPTPAPVVMDHASFAATPLSFDNLVKDGGEGTAGQMAQVARRAVESA